LPIDSVPAYLGEMAPARRFKNRLFSALCLLSIGIAGIALIYLLTTIVLDGAPRLSAAFFTEFPSRLPARAGIKAALFGTLWVIGLSALVAVPVGVAAAIYLEELAHRRNRLTAFIQLNISNLAGVPSIVYGLLGLALFVRWLAFDRSILSGALTMALLILPMIILVTQEALKTVPKSLRDGSLALGATKWQTVRKQVLPIAAPGIFTGIILAVSRAIGETAPLITIGAATAWFVPTKISDGFTVLPIQIFDWSSRPQKGFHENAAAAILVLLIALLMLNSIAIFLRARAQKRAV